MIQFINFYIKIIRNYFSKQIFYFYHCHLWSESSQIIGHDLICYNTLNHSSSMQTKWLGSFDLVYSIPSSRFNRPILSEWWFTLYSTLYSWRAFLASVTSCRELYHKVPCVNGIFDLPSQKSRQKELQSHFMGPIEAEDK